MSVAAHKLTDRGLDLAIEVTYAPAEAPSVETSILADMADRLYDWRRRRDVAFEGCGSVFAEPCWDILLDLFSSQVRGRRVALSSASIAARCPPTTGIRHVQRLEKAGLVVREPDVQDGRRYWIRLTGKADDLLRGHLSDLVRIDQRLEPPEGMFRPNGRGPNA